jgi:hypothetical protein
MSRDHLCVSRETLLCRVAGKVCGVSRESWLARVSRESLPDAELREYHAEKLLHIYSTRDPAQPIRGKSKLLGPDFQWCMSIPECIADVRKCVMKQFDVPESGGENITCISDFVFSDIPNRLNKRCHPFAGNS